LLSEQRGLPSRQLATTALAACRDWTEAGELADDFALVVIKRTA